MALTLDYTSPNYDAYADIATMDAEVAKHVILNGGTDGGWSTLSVADKEVMIIASTSFTDSLDWYGIRNTEIVNPYRTQPRSGLLYPDGTTVPDDTITDEVVAMMACWIVATLISNANSNVSASGIKKKKVGDVEIEYVVSDKAGELVSDIEACPAKNIPSDWYRSNLVLGGIGMVGLSRFP